MKRVAGENFSVETLHPFGELWTPETPELNVDALMEREIDEVVAAVREAGLVVLSNTSIGPRWQPIPPDPSSSIAHTDRGPYGDSVAVQMLHSKEGRSVGTRYSKPADLTATAKAALPELKGIVDRAPAWIVEDYRLARLLERYEHPEGAYSYDFLDPPLRILEKLTVMAQQISGVYWEAEQDLQEVSKRYPELLATFRALQSFFVKVSSTAAGYTHHWDAHPKSTVLVSQNPNDRFSNPDKMIHHSRELPTIANGETGLWRDLILDTSFDGTGPFRAYSEILARRSFPRR